MDIQFNIFSALSFNGMNIFFMFSPLNSGRLLPVLFLPCFWAEVDPMDNRDLKIELLTILADGCKKHPAYKALRPATGRCDSYLSGLSKSCF